MYLHHPVACSIDVLAKNPEFSLWEGVVILEVELREWLFDTDFISLWEGVMSPQAKYFSLGGCGVPAMKLLPMDRLMALMR